MVLKKKLYNAIYYPALSDFANLCDGLTGKKQAIWEDKRRFFEHHQSLLS